MKEIEQRWKIGMEAMEKEIYSGKDELEKK